MTPRLRPLWAYVVGLLPVVLVWVVLVGWLATLLVRQGESTEQADEATVREWLDEARNFRKTLPDLVREYAHARATDSDRSAEKRAELLEHMRSLAEPTRAYLNQLPGFPVVHRIEAEMAGEVVAWESPLPRPRAGRESRVRRLEYRPFGPDDPSAVIRCDYQMHAYNRLQSRETERRRTSVVAGALLLAASALAAVFVTRFVRRERRRELAQLTAQASADHAARELLEAKVREQDAARVREELDRELLRQQLSAAQLRTRADEAEKQTLEMRSQLYASIGIMAGSYAHNIKNLLVRPNDLLSRCLESPSLSREQAGMLGEVRITLGTVTERLQQILRTVRRDPGRSELTTVDVAALVRETAATWSDMAREKWKVVLTGDAPADALVVRGDLSHLQQALENLIFNARDATFEMRSRLREQARTAPLSERKDKLIEAAGWRGEVHVGVRRSADGGAVVEVRDNGVGMTPEVRARCLETHFSTKRDNALYEGYNAGTGLGLSFVAVVLEHHGARLEVESEPTRGAVFRVTFPALGTALDARAPAD